MTERPEITPLGDGAEFDLIRRFYSGAGARPRSEIPVGPGDDCAVVTGEGIALSSELSVEGIHFRREWLSPREIGFRAAAGALSDLAAVAARPIGLLAALALPERDAGAFAEELMAGVREAAEMFGGTLLGGDLSRSVGAVVIAVTVVGEAPDPVLRSGALPGDELWVTGDLGGAAAAVQALLAGETPDPSARERLARPLARIPEARWLGARGVLRAMVDLSDGLAGDAAHLAAASGVAVLLSAELIPVHPAALARAESRSDALRLAMSGGEDYEIFLSAPPGAVREHAADFERETGTRLTCVGRVGAGSGVWWVDAEGRRYPMEAGGFQHFGEGT